MEKSMDTSRQLNVYKGLQEWVPPQYIKKDLAVVGEYTKDQALAILTDVLARYQGRNFYSSTTLRLEEELVNICCALDGVTDSNVFMKHSMVPIIIKRLTPQMYFGYLWTMSLPEDCTIDMSYYTIEWFALESRILKDDADLTIIDPSTVRIKAKDVHSRPVEYEVEIPKWLREVASRESVTMRDIQNIYDKR